MIIKLIRQPQLQQVTLQQHLHLIILKHQLTLNLHNRQQLQLLHLAILQLQILNRVIHQRHQQITPHQLLQMTELNQVLNLYPNQNQMMNQLHQMKNKMMKDKRKKKETQMKKKKKHKLALESFSSSHLFFQLLYCCHQFIAIGNNMQGFKF